MANVLTGHYKFPQAPGEGRNERAKPHLGLSCLGDRLHWEPLSGVILYTTENNQSDRRPVFFYYFQNILFSKGEFSLTGIHFDDGILGLEPVQLYLGRKRVLWVYVTLKKGGEEKITQIGVPGQMGKPFPHRATCIVEAWVYKMYSS